MLGKECNLYMNIRERYENFRSRCNLSNDYNKCLKENKTKEKDV